MISSWLEESCRGAGDGGVDVDKFKHKSWSRDEVCKYFLFPRCRKVGSGIRLGIFLQDQLAF